MTSSKINLLLIIFSGLVLTGCSSLTIEHTVAEGGILMPSADLKRIVSGNTLQMYEYNSYATVTFFENGKLLGKNNYDTGSKGRWYIDDNDKLCIRYLKWGSKDLVCYAVYKVGDEYRQFGPSGLFAGSFTLITAPDPETSSQEVAETAKQDASTTTPVPAVVPIPTSSSSQSQKSEIAQGDSIKSPEKETTAIQAKTDVSIADKAQNCPGCDFQKANLAGAKLKKAVLHGSNLTGANLQGANLKMANLRGAILKGADFSKANLAGANLAGADLTGANLTGAELFGTNLKGATLEGVIGADFMGAIK